MSNPTPPPAPAIKKWRLAEFYHGDLRHEYLTDLLIKNGDFLIRQSGQNCNVLSVRWDNKIRNFQPDFDGTTYSLGEKEFERFEDLIYHHHVNKISIGKDNVFLVDAIRYNKTLYKADDIEVLGDLGEGNFGKVYRVRIKSENRACAMKTMHENVPREMREMFMKEMDMMATMHHENIVQCVGTVESDAEVKILLELINKGSLESLLHRNKLTDRGKARLLCHVAKGMAYLHRRNIIHRDLAARNILVHMEPESSRIVAKVSDFGLSRRDDSGRGYQLQSAQKLPLRWLAPECFTKRSWTKASDVWSFGILMWEVYMNGAEPYSDMNLEEARELSKYISKGGHPSEIPGMHQLMRDIMLSCWKLKEEDRPNMDQLREKLLKTYPKLPSVRASTSASARDHSQKSGSGSQDSVN